MRMKKNTLILLLIVVSTLLSAQEQERRPKSEEFHARKWQYLTEKAKLTPAEAELIKPVFLDYEKTMWSQHEKNREFFRSAMRNKNEKPNFAELNDRYAEEELTQAQNFKNYHLRLRTLLSAETLFRYYKAERDFKRELLQNLHNRPPRNDKQ